MKSAMKNRGSVILLVVGVLAALALMGSVFILMAWNDKKEASVINQAAPMRPIAESQVMRIAAALKDDLFIDASGPYNSTTNPRTGAAIINTDDWKRYVDYPNPDPAEYGAAAGSLWSDLHLASTERAPANGPVTALPLPFTGTYPSVGHWPKISTLQTESDYPSQATFVASFLNVATNDAGLVDSDGDGVNDARLYNTGIVDKSGNPYYAAVRVIDLSGLLNINTGDTYQVPTALGTVLSAGFVSPGTTSGRIPLPAGNAIQMGRVRTDRGQASDVFTYSTDYVNCVETPVNNTIRPFDWSDELALRWGTAAGPMSSGRLMAALDTEWGRFRPYLTTYSATRNYAEGGGTKADLNASLATVDRATAFTNYYNAFRRRYPGTAAPADYQRAAQFAVNLIDYRDGDERATFAVAPDDATQRAFGIERQPFLSHAWYKLEIDPGATPATDPPVPDDANTLYAIVLYNPYAAAIDMGGWAIRVTGPNPPVPATIALPANTTIPGGGRFVIHCGTKGGQTVQRDATATPEWVVAGLSPRHTVGLYRPTYEVDGTTPRPTTDYEAVLRVQPADFGAADPDILASSPTPIAATDTHMASLRKDDTPARFAIAVGAKDPQTTLTDYTTTNIDVATGFDASIAPNNIPPTPVYIRGYGGGVDAKLASLADLCRVFYVGPSDTVPLDDVLFQDAAERVRIDNSRMSSLRFVSSASTLAAAADAFTVAPTARWGKININTAPAAVLCSLPNWLPATGDYGLWLACELVGFRDKLESYNVDPSVVTVPTKNSPAAYNQSTRDYSLGRAAPLQADPSISADVQMSTAAGQLRTNAGFAGAGEISFLFRSLYPVFPIPGYGPPPGGIAYNLGPGGTDDGYTASSVIPTPPDLVKYEMRYAYLSNLISVNSDVYCAYVYVQMGAPWVQNTVYRFGNVVTVGGAAYSCQHVDTATPWTSPTTPASDLPNWKQINLTKRNYIAIIDRSNCVTAADTPTVRAFAEVK